MRYGFILAAALAAMSTTSARADDEWCGYATGDKALIECGYSSDRSMRECRRQGRRVLCRSGIRIDTKRPTALQPANFTPAR